jgi:hypothetical protein
VSRRRLALIGACALLLAGALTGCGGDDDEGEAATTTAAASTAGGGGTAERLDASQWAEYQSSAASFTKANQTALAKVKTCQAKAPSNTSDFDACMGDTLPNVEQATGDLRTTLEGFEGDVAGACESARASFAGYLKNYQATASSLENSVSSGSVPGYTAGVQNIKTVAVAGTPAKEAFESSCAPA